MKILIIEDDKSVANSLVKGLTEKTFSAEVAYDGNSGLAMARKNHYDVLIVDRMLPDLDGLSLIRTLRDDGNETPILVLTALGEVDNTVEGFDAGADDYLTKPFAFAELIARLKSLVKRRGGTIQADTLLTIGDLVIDKIERTVTRESQLIRLQPREFDLLACLADNQGEAVTREMLLEKVWGLTFDPQTNIIDVHISRVRNKVDKGFRDPMINTVRGVGYILDKPRG